MYKIYIIFKKACNVFEKALYYIDLWLTRNEDRICDVLRVVTWVILAAAMILWAACIVKIY